MAQPLKFVIPGEELLSIERYRIGRYRKLKEDSKILARAPISEVQDVVIGLTPSDRIFIGVNVEFEGLLPLHEYSISAKEFLLTNLALNFERNVLIMPCLVPLFLDQDVSLLLVPQNNRLALSDRNAAAQICLDPEHCSHTMCRALMAAKRSYARYSQCPSGVALKCEGKVYRGWYIESEQYTRSLGPLQAALVDFVARSEGKEFENITEAVLVEMNDADVSQEATARTLIETIAPRCTFSFLHCYKTEEI